MIVMNVILMTIFTGENVLVTRVRKWYRKCQSGSN